MKTNSITKIADNFPEGRDLFIKRGQGNYDRKRTWHQMPRRGGVRKAAREELRWQIKILRGQ